MQGALADLNAALALDGSNMLALRHRAHARLELLDFQARRAGRLTRVLTANGRHCS
jgi:hypothetical protein